MNSRYHYSRVWPLLHVCCIAVAIGLLSVFAFAVSVRQGKLNLTMADESAIIKSALEEMLKLRGPSESGKVIYLSTSNVRLKIAPEVAGAEAVLLTPEEIEEEAMSGVRYFSISKFEVRGEKVIVWLAEVWWYKGKSYGDSGMMYECRKKAGRWQVRSVGGFAS